MKTKSFGILIVLVIALMLTSSVFACATWIHSVPSCDGITVTANPPAKYPGDNSYKDPVIQSGTGFFGWDGKTTFTPTVSVQYRKWVSEGHNEGHGKGQHWVDTSHYVYKTLTDSGEKVTRPECYVPCTETVVSGYSTWTDWMSTDNPLVETRSRQEILVDARDAKFACGFGDKETENRDLEFCSVYPDDPSCIVCRWDENLTMADEACVEPPVCEWNPNLYASDEECVQPPVMCEWNDTLEASDPACKEPYKEPWKPIIPEYVCDVPGCGPNTGTMWWEDYVSEKGIVFFSTSEEKCWEELVLVTSDEPDFVPYYKWVTHHSYISEGIAGSAFSMTYGPEYVLTPAVKGDDGLWRVGIPMGVTNPIFVVGTHDGPFLFSMLSDGTLVNVLTDGWIITPISSALGLLP